MLQPQKHFWSYYDDKTLEDLLNKNKSEIKKKLSFLLKHQLRIIPDIAFFMDDSLDYIDKIDEALKGGGENPIK